MIFLSVKIIFSNVLFGRMFGRMEHHATKSDFFYIDNESNLCFLFLFSISHLNTYL